MSLVALYAHAGYLRWYSDPEFIRSLPLTQDTTYDDGTYRDFEIKGDSMENYFFERDIIRAKYLPEIYWEKRLHVGQLFVILHKTDGVVFKQLVDHNPNSGDLTLHSFNDYYEDYTVNLRDVQQLWYYTEYRSRRLFKQVR
ncbi:MAG: helix-turn-helix transcriptional regulator [Salibacteraceae bacterium]